LDILDGWFYRGAVETAVHVCVGFNQYGSWRSRRSRRPGIITGGLAHCSCRRGDSDKIGLLWIRGTLDTITDRKESVEALNKVGVTIEKV
jgi:hypothetical protein